METLGLFMIVGGGFGALLFNFNAEWGDKCAVVIRNALLAIAIAGFVFLVVGICQINKMPVYEYRINVHYIDGSTRVLLFDSKKDPKINAHRGTYWLEYAEGDELGVVRFDIISKIEIKRKEK